MVRKALRKIARYCFNRLQERSTRMGIIAACASVGVVINPDQLQNVVVVGTAVLGLVEAIFPDSPPDKTVIQDFKVNMK